MSTFTQPGVSCDRSPGRVVFEFVRPSDQVSESGVGDGADGSPGKGSSSTGINARFGTVPAINISVRRNSGGTSVT